MGQQSLWYVMYYFCCTGSLTYNISSFVLLVLSSSFPWFSGGLYVMIYHWYIKYTLTTKHFNGEWIQLLWCTIVFHTLKDQNNWMHLHLLLCVCSPVFSKFEQLFNMCLAWLALRNLQTFTRRQDLGSRQDYTSINVSASQNQPNQVITLISFSSFVVI